MADDHHPHATPSHSREPPASYDRPMEGQTLPSWNNRLPGDHIAPSHRPIVPARKSAGRPRGRAASRGGAPLGRSASFPDLAQDPIGHFPSEFDTGHFQAPSKPTSTQALMALLGTQERFTRAVERNSDVITDVMRDLTDELHDGFERFADVANSSGKLQLEVGKILDNQSTIIDNQHEYLNRFEDMVEDVADIAHSMCPAATPAPLSAAAATASAPLPPASTTGVSFPGPATDSAPTPTPSAAPAASSSPRGRKRSHADSDTSSPEASGVPALLQRMTNPPALNVSTVDAPQTKRNKPSAKARGKQRERPAGSQRATRE
ncbi:hypothetical protein GGX14DRAFT_567669 [Mycena pura]|uniref:Uncharacterized protein n=1 Tax=Mycena pura TaxID=153505 RepID=A0AAD6VE48_9AGAR|nr:hypothetical protein GGX14DRAFT_567669 [Mycena pura]